MTVGLRIPAKLPAAAEVYAEAGIKVFRVRRNKTPYANCPRCDRQSSLYVKHRPEDCQCGVPTCHGFWAASTDLDLVRRWWREEPDANIGAPCKLNGWAVVDVDPRNGGKESYQALEQRVGVLPGTTMQLTGGGGLHMLYRSPDFDLPGLGGPGIDFKHNGYILLAPSGHSSGGRYQWAGDGSYIAPSVAWPEALLPRKQRRQLLPPPRATPRHRFPLQERRQQRPGGGRMWTVADLVQHVMDSHEGNRNNAFFFAACRAHELAEQNLIDLAEAEMGLLSAASAMGLTDSETRASFDSASTRPSDRGWVA
ncbi:bifunctional DNA primase/polymerase [Streptomyces cylindrosporus]|uniref:Bifunctional DNA primase/polymerase n=1 Tax=Streptomyces cylindrosporus TaxID=2927583 RepID=A0ABS9Y6I0_9ACTN|nr:bifunctional DNA primase/polymerase [Streptomyces cylindrosporus]MCI3272125.1 bifunctional DNA primase/polymerase [Streptomyces cylindrosporus]